MIDSQVGGLPGLGWRRVVLTGVLLTVLAALGFLAVGALEPPPARSADAPVEEFSAGRANDHLNAIAQRPHPLGSDDHARVRQYIVDTAMSLGADVRVETGHVTQPRWGNPFRSAEVHNVIATVPGSAPDTSGGKALLIAAHYDSVPTGPGAGDDAAAVAAMLETMRALRDSGGVRNDLVFLFTDGEELGLLGARRFVARHEMGDFGAVLNWEARGSGGPVLMFETSTGNHPLVAALADADTRLVSNSLAYEVYRRMPNNSDFTEFRDAGAAGMNGAFIEGITDYHSASDTPANLNRNSMQHHGELMLSLSRILGGSDLRTMKGADAVYFDLFSAVLVHYPTGAAVALAVLSVAAVGALMVWGTRRGTLSVRGVLATSGSVFAAMIVTGVLAFGLWWLVMLVRPELGHLPLSQPHSPGGFAAGFALLTGTVLLLTATLLRYRRSSELLAGVLLVLCLLLAVSVVTVPGASYVLQWPVVAALPALWWWTRREREGRDHTGALLAAVSSAVTVVLFAPLVHNLLVALGVSLAWAAMVFAVLGAGLLLPLLVRLPRSGLLAAVCGLIAVAVLGTSVLTTGFSKEEPRPNAVVYARDLSPTAEREAQWLSGDPVPDEWTLPVLGQAPEQIDAGSYYPEFSGRDMLTAPAPAVDLMPPTVEVLQDSTSGGTRTLRLRVDSPRQAWKLQVRLPVARLHACVVGGERLDARDLEIDAQATGGAVFQYFGAHSGVELTCEVDTAGELPIEVTDYTVGLPAEIATLLKPRPDDTVPVSYGVGISDGAVVRDVVIL